jgi:hypothetical protein
MCVASRLFGEQIFTKETMRDKSKDKRKKPAAPSREGNPKKQPESAEDDTVGLSGYGADSVLVHLREQERKRDKNGKA